MLFGIGVDIVETVRFQRMLDRYGDRIAQRVLTEREFDQFVQRNRSLNFLATRFAAKEAASKALGCGISNGVGFHSIEVVNNKNGKPELIFYQEAENIVQTNRVSNSLLTLSDEKHYAVAMVVLEAV